MERITGYSLIISFDLDGVIYRGTELLPHAGAAGERARRSGYAVYYGTNNTYHGVEEIAQTLTRLGIETAAEQVVSAASATAWVLKELDPPCRRALVTGTKELQAELERSGIATVRSLDEGPIDAVVASLSEGFDFDTLCQAHVALYHDGARLIVPSNDKRFPWQTGTMPGDGALAAALEYSAATEMVVVGKPGRRMFDEIINRENAVPDDLVIIGDNLETDIGAAHNVGARSVLVLTGISSRAEALAAPAHQRPTWIAADLSQLPWDLF